MSPFPLRNSIRLNSKIYRWKALPSRVRQLLDIKDALVTDSDFFAPDLKYGQRCYEVTFSVASELRTSQADIIVPFGTFAVLIKFHRGWTDTPETWLINQEAIQFIRLCTMPPNRDEPPEASND